MLITDQSGHEKKAKLINNSIIFLLFTFFLINQLMKSYFLFKLILIQLIIKKIKINEKLD